MLIWNGKLIYLSGSRQLIFSLLLLKIKYWAVYTAPTGNSSYQSGRKQLFAEILVVWAVNLELFFLDGDQSFSSLSPLTSKYKIYIIIIFKYSPCGFILFWSRCKYCIIIVLFQFLIVIVLFQSLIVVLMFQSLIVVVLFQSLGVEYKNNYFIIKVMTAKGSDHYSIREFHFLTCI